MALVATKDDCRQGAEGPESCGVHARSGRVLLVHELGVSNGPSEGKSPFTRARRKEAR